jgi:rhodanese-related sulfurtransferase
LQGNQYVLDLRSKNAYDASHIPGAVHMPMNRLFFHFEEAIEPMRYDRIVLACYTGQSAAYATSLLRMLGYQNVFSLKWGMASWNEKLAKKWTEHPRVRRPLALSREPIKPAGKYGLPEISTGEKRRKDILKARVKTLLARGYSKVSVPPDALNRIFPWQTVVAYCDKAVYDRGHVPGAIHFPIKESLARNADLLKLPVDKQILVYSENGFESAYAVAFLQLLGYNAKTVQFGMNAFAADAIHGFNRSEVHQYALVDHGNKLVFEEKFQSAPEKKKIIPTPKPAVPKVQEEEEGC